MTQVDLTEQQRAALLANDGFVQGSSFVLISLDRFREMAGFDADRELAESLAAIDKAVEDVRQGRTIALEEARRLFDEKYGVQN